MDVRPYQPSHRDACLAVFHSLTPGLLDPTLLPVFEAWLETAAGPYFVLEHEASVVGCGGYSFSPDGTAATLQWGMVHGSSQKMGLGRSCCSTESARSAGQARPPWSSQKYRAHRPAFSKSRDSVSMESKTTPWN